ncbi:hypothetical protein LC20_02087 [Yersinia hibernica]|uniref:Uncharacterized protein n=2 Tax=Yersinia TaxID=629 RepID=A0A7U4GEP4_YEREN|nr:hypothetical protein LC20_02087 [Yersinia hibernica]
MNRHGNTFQGMMTSASVTRPGAIKNIHSTAAQQTPAAKIALYNPLNRHGNTFQGMSASASVTRPGAIKNIHSTAAQQTSAAKIALYNPLNRHGNTFQGMNASASVTRPGVIKNIHSTAAQQTPAAKIALYNPLNRHGNTFQGMNASVPVTRPGTIKNIHPIVGSAINKTAGILENDGTLTKVAGLANSRHVNADSYNQANEYATFSGEYNQLAECELDEHLSDSFPLFGNSLKDSPDESSPCVEETEIHSKPLNKDYYTLTYGLD